MRICIPTETNMSFEATVYGHFGSASYFTIYDRDKDDFGKCLLPTPSFSLSHNGPAQTEVEP